MNKETATLYLTVCDTEEASNIIGMLTSEQLIISANITASSDVDHSFEHHIAEDTEVTICISVTEENLEQTMRKINTVHDHSASPIKIKSDHPSAIAFKSWSATKFFPENY